MKKTMEGWNQSKKNFNEFAQPGDEIDEEIYYYFLEVVPPINYSSWGFLMGEPANHTESGEGIYEAFQKGHGQYYRYLGPMTAEQFKVAKYE